MARDVLGEVGDNLQSSGGTVTAEDLPTVMASDVNGAVSASGFRPIYLALGSERVRNVGLLVQAAFTGTATDYWNGHLAVSRYSLGNPNALASLQVIAKRTTALYTTAMVVRRAWTWGEVPWLESAALLGPRDVLGVYWEKVGVPANLTNLMVYGIKLSPGPIGVEMN